MNQPSGSIIEIGAVCWDARQSKMLSAFSTLVTLSDGEVLDDFITKLTGITPQDFDSPWAMSLPEALTSLQDWAIEAGCSRYMAAWGNDYFDIKQACIATGTPHPWKNYLNIKEMATVMRTQFKGKARGGLKSALNAFGLEFVGTQHRALEDANNTARLLGELLRGTRLINAVKEVIK